MEIGEHRWRFVKEMVRYWTEIYMYCTGIESNFIVASQIDQNEYFDKGGLQ